MVGEEFQYQYGEDSDNIAGFCKKTTTFFSIYQKKKKRVILKCCGMVEMQETEFADSWLKNLTHTHTTCYSSKSPPKEKRREIVFRFV